MNLNNIISKEKNSTTTDIQLPQGYYTFSQLKTLLSTHNIEIEKLYDNHVTIECKDQSTKLHLKEFGTLLGFEKNATLTTKTTSTFSASMINKLKDIEIYSNILEYSHIYQPMTEDSIYYQFSSLLATLAIDTTQPLNGNFTEYNLNTMKLPCKQYDGQEVKFEVKSGGVSDDYEIYLTLEVL